MIQKIKDVLKAAGVDSYLVSEIKNETVELFFIKQELDMRRGKSATNYEVTVYRSFKDGEKEYLGSSTVFLFPTMDKEEMLSALQDAFASAVYVKNPTYPVYQGPQADKIEMQSSLNGHSLGEIADQMTRALFSADNREDAYINSAELFVKKTDIHTIASTGTDVAYSKKSVWCEFVVQAKKPQDVEQYFSVAYDDLDTEALTGKVKKALDTVCDRARADKMPVDGEYDVILSDKQLEEVLSFYIARASASMVYAHYSDYKVGDMIQGQSCQGEKLNLRLIADSPYSPEGIPMKERTLVKDGQLGLLFGGNRFSSYLGIEPTGDYTCFALDNGTVPFEEMKQGSLYPVSFSDFQMDPLSGRFGGEIRLAYLYTEKGVEILTGGSVNGSILDKQGMLTFSTEQYKDANYQGPFAVKIPSVAVSGR